MKKMLVLSMLILATVTFSGCGQQKSEPNKNSAPDKPIANNSQTTNNPASEKNNWKTYQNSQYGFSMKYPAKTVYNENKTGNILALVFEDEGTNKNLSSPILNFQIKNSDYKTIEEYKSYLLESLKNCQPQAGIPDLCRKYNFSQTTVLENQALIDNWEGNGLKTVWFIKNGLLYKFSGHTLKNGFDVDQMIANFNFNN